MLFNFEWQDAVEILKIRLSKNIKFNLANILIDKIQFLDEIAGLLIVSKLKDSYIKYSLFLLIENRIQNINSLGRFNFLSIFLQKLTRQSLVKILIDLSNTPCFSEAFPFKVEESLLERLKWQKLSSGLFINNSNLVLEFLAPFTDLNEQKHRAELLIEKGYGFNWESVVAILKIFSDEEKRLELARKIIHKIYSVESFELFLAFCTFDVQYESLTGFSLDSKMSLTLLLIKNVHQFLKAEIGR